MKTNYFTAVKKPLYYGDNKKRIEDKVAIVRQDTKACIGIVSPDFKIVDDNQLLEYFAGITKKLQLKWNIVKRNEIRGGKKTITEIEFPDLTMKVGHKDDILTCRANIINGFDGYSSAKLILGFFRLICKNGMVIGKKEMAIGYKHVGEVNGKLVQQFEKYMKIKLEDSKKQILLLNNIKFSDESEIESVIKKTTILGKTYSEAVFEALEKEKIANKLSGWALYNAYTYVIAHIMKINPEAKLNKLKQLNIAALGWK